MCQGARKQSCFHGFHVLLDYYAWQFGAVLQGLQLLRIELAVKIGMLDNIENHLYFLCAERQLAKSKWHHWWSIQVLGKWWAYNCWSRCFGMFTAKILLDFLLLRVLDTCANRWVPSLFLNVEVLQWQTTGPCRISAPLCDLLWVLSEVIILVSGKSVSALRTMQNLVIDLLQILVTEATAQVPYGKAFGASALESTSSYAWKALQNATVWAYAVTVFSWTTILNHYFIKCCKVVLYWPWNEFCGHFQ